jgi:hypothetical protein
LHGGKKLQDGYFVMEFGCETNVFVIFGNEVRGGGKHKDKQLGKMSDNLCAC